MKFFPSTFMIPCSIFDVQVSKNWKSFNFQYLEYKFLSNRVKSTASRLPVRLVYYEACLQRDDATHREKYLKSSYGKHFIKQRIKNYLLEDGQT